MSKPSGCHILTPSVPSTPQASEIPVEYTVREEYLSEPESLSSLTSLEAELLPGHTKESPNYCVKWRKHHKAQLSIPPPPEHLSWNSEVELQVESTFSSSSHPKPHPRWSDTPEPSISTFQVAPKSSVIPPTSPKFKTPKNIKGNNNFSYKKKPQKIHYQ